MFILKLCQMNEPEEQKAELHYNENYQTKSINMQLVTYTLKNKT